MMAASTKLLSEAPLGSKIAGNSSNNPGVSFNNTGINYGQQIGEIKQQYFTTISDETSHKSFAESSFRKYQNLRLPSTCDWLLEDESYKAWDKCKIQRVRISGKVGCGKSTLVARAIEEAQRKEKTDKGHRVLYFFASKHVSLGSLSDVDEARLKDLQPTLKNVLLTFWDQLGVDEDGGIGSAATKDFSEHELKDGIILKLKDSKATHISMFIDGNDKIEVSLLSSHTQAGRANSEIRVTTDKNGQDMKEFLRARLSKKILQQNEAEKDSTEEKDTAGKELTMEEKEEAEDIVEKIMKRAQEMFLWAAVMLDLVCRAHDKKERDQVLERLLVPKSIQDDYEKLVEGWEGKTARGRLEEWQRKLARQATGLLAHKQGLLSYDALTEVLDEELPEPGAQKREAEKQLREAEKQLRKAEEQLREAEARKRKAEVQRQEAEVRKLEAEVRKLEADAPKREAEVRKRVSQEVVDCCSPFVEYDGDLRIFRFAHPSMHDFFVNRDASRTSFADQTLAYLCRPAFRRGPFSGAEWWDMGELRPFLDRHSFLGFAAANWVEAVRSSKAANGQNRKSTRNLLAELYRSEDNLLLAFQVLRLAAHDSVPTQLRSAHIFSLFGLFDNLFSSSSRFTTVLDAAIADSDGRNALHWALHANDQYTRLQTARILLPADKQQATDMMAARDPTDLTPLHYAARQGDLGVVRLLLGRDPDKKRVLDFCSKKYGTPLMMAAKHGHVDIVKELINAGADLDIECDVGNVLHAAAAAAPDKAAHACVEVILREHPRPRRLDVNCHDVGTPLHMAAYHGCETVVKLLLENDFSAREKSWEHCSTITAAAAGCRRGTDPKPFIRIMEMLHDAGAKPHAVGTSGYFALHHAAQFNQPEIARFLHNCGADCRQKSTVGTPLDLAVGLGHVKVVMALLEPRQKRQRAHIREKSERQKRQAEKERKRKEEKKAKSASRDDSIRRRVLLAFWEPLWHSAVAANDMTRIYWLVDQYEQTCGAAIQQKTSWLVKALAPLGTAVFASVVGLMERPREQQQKHQKPTHWRRKASQVLSSTTKGILRLHAFCDTTLSYFQLKVHNDRRLRSATVGTEFDASTYEEILDRLTLAAVHMLSKAFEHNNLDAVSPLAEAWIDALLTIKSVGLLEKLVEKRAQALKLILTDTSKSPAEKRHDAGILAKVGIELLAVALKRSHRDDAGAARLARSLSKLWASALHDAGGPAADATRVEDIHHVCNAFLEMFRHACELPSSSTSEQDEQSERVKRVRLLALVGAEIVVEAVRTDNEPLINNMRRMMDESRNSAATAGLTKDVQEVLMEKLDSLEKAGSTAPPKGEGEKRDSVIDGQTTPVHNDKEMGEEVGGKDRGSNGKSNANEGGDHERSEDDTTNDGSSENNGEELKVDEEVESRRLRITLRILRGEE
ncbi:putative ankyrin repeat protein [Lasiodiplodia theobromae]|uniref:Ankyrin repeat protein n=1 Tax=Lasiodiplodia theobromae TaxID=45133 RepID=A0A8H7MDJ3_9PEZI|nr:putative ankyrin repeat protein [Lasiodiplodia theobromae]